MLRAAGIEGRVTLEFVVDTAGHAELRVTFAKRVCKLCVVPVKREVGGDRLETLITAAKSISGPRLVEGKKQRKGNVNRHVQIRED